jgi:hypothetical protein
MLGYHGKKIKEGKMKRFFLFCSMGVIFSLVFFADDLSAQPPIAGIEPGAKVKIVKKDGSVSEGKIVKATETAYLINTDQGKVSKYLKDIKKITDTGKVDLGGGISYRPVHEYVTTKDQSFQGVYFGGQGMAFEIDLGAVGIQRLWIESLKSIEVIESGAAVASGCTVTCPHCGKPIRVLLSKESLADPQTYLEKIGGK